MPDKESRLDQRDDEKVGWTNGTIFAIDGDYLTTDTWTTDAWTTDTWTTDAWTTDA